MTTGRGAFLASRYPSLLAFLVAASALWGWAHRFVLDDAFISFRYAVNLAAGRGFVWNPGERVEGYTNFLWTALLAIPQAFGIDLLAFCFVVGPALSALTLYLTSRLALDLLGSKPLALLSVALLGVHPTFAAFATGGLETPLLTTLVTALAWLVLRRGREGPATVGEAAAVSLVAAAALMTRLDAAVVAGPLLVVAAWPLLRAGATGRVRLAALVLPAAALVGAWFAWRTAYYGSLLPNSFAVRRMGTDAWMAGFEYLGAFLGSYYLWPFVVLFAASLRKAFAAGAGGIATLVILLAVQYAYVVHVGGDFMEFRFLVPTLPFLVVAIAWVSFGWIRRPLLGAALVAVVAAGMAHHARTFVYRDGIESRWLLTAHLFDPASDWIGIGRSLGATFRDAPDVRIGVTAAGAIPYFANLPAVDMLGINDVWIARHGVVFEGAPGHSRFAPLAYLAERRVNLVLGHPTLVGLSPPDRAAYSYDELRERRIVIDDTPAHLPGEATVLEIPLDPGRAVLALYLAPHPAVDAAIAAGRWGRFAIARGGDAGGAAAGAAPEPGS